MTNFFLQFRPVCVTSCYTQSINQKHICIAPYVANESEVHKHVVILFNIFTNLQSRKKEKKLVFDAFAVFVFENACTFSTPAFLVLHLVELYHISLT